MTRFYGVNGWVLAVCTAAGEAGGSFRSLAPRRMPTYVGTPDRERSRQEAGRRARRKLRVYCAANGLNRLGTLTYRGDGCHDPKRLREDVGEFFRGLRSGLGGKALPYAWTPEWHKSGHGQHVHFAVGRYVRRSIIEDAWRRGFVHIKLLGDLPVGSGSLEEARRAAGYLSKYVGKAFDENRVPGLHRYEVAQGFQPAIDYVRGRTADEALNAACGLFDGRRPQLVWWSQESDWPRPPSVWASWRG
jgi:hypothetical protein